MTTRKTKAVLEHEVSDMRREVRHAKDELFYWRWGCAFAAVTGFAFGYLFAPVL